MCRFCKLTSRQQWFIAAALYAATVAVTTFAVVCAVLADTDPSVDVGLAVSDW